MSTLSRLFTGRNQPRKVSLVLLLVILLAGSGILIIKTHASTPTASLEAESGSLSSCVSSVSDTSASGNSAVQFGSGSCSSTPTNLDATGATVPDTDYPIPAGAIFMATNGNDSNPGTQASPVLTLNKAISLVPSGGTIVVRAGDYRDWYNNGSGNYAFATKPFTLQAYPHEQVWFDGADVIPATSWTSDGAGHWYMSWSTPSFCNGAYYDFPYNNQSKAPSNLTGASGKTYSDNTGPCSHWDQYGNTEANYPAAGDPQMVFINGQQMPEVDQLSLATTGAFYYDWANKKIYISTNPSGNTVELSSRPTALVLSATGGGYTIRGIGFKRYATNEYNNLTEAAVYAGGGPNDVFENDAFTQMAAYGLGIANPTGVVVNHDVFASNGFTGMTANGHSNSGGATDGLIIENSVINNNNDEHYGLNCSLSCAAAGIKLGHMVGFTVKDNIFENNAGHGIWCDTGCTNGVIVENLVQNNTLSGIFYEVSDTGIIASNLTYNNAQYGIRVASADTKIYNNTDISSNSNGGIWIYDDSRTPTTSPGSGPDTTNVQIVNNLLVNLNNTVCAVESQGDSNTGTNTEPSQFYSAFDYNGYYRVNSGKKLMRWNPYGASETDYNSASAFYSAQGWDQHSIDVVGGSDPFFVNLAGGNYQVRPGSAAYQSGTTIPSDVMAALNLTSGTGYSRGAITWPGE